MKEDILLNQKKCKNIVFGAFVVQLIIVFLICWVIPNINPMFVYGGQISYWSPQVFGIIISTILLYGFSRHTRYDKSKMYFIYIDVAIAIEFFCEILSWMLDGKLQYRNINMLCVTMNLILNSVIDYLFWMFLKYLYDEEGKISNKFEKILIVILMVIGFIIPLINNFFEFGFYIDEFGYTNTKMPYMIILYLVPIIITAMIFLFIMKVKVNIEEKVILLLYILIPVLVFIVGLENAKVFNYYYLVLFAIYIFLFCNLIVNKEKLNMEKEIILEGKRKELKVARIIQKSMLPKVFEDGKKIGIDISGYMEPANEVGGDFYDYFVIDENRIAVYVADVSDKGVSASLFMAIGKILLSKAIEEEATLKEALNSVHRTIIKNNNKGMFITTFVGIIDIKNKTLTYVNAGHCFPLIKINGEQPKYLEDIHGTFMGCKLFKNINYRQSVIDFNKGDLLCLYTDGVIEAQNDKEELYGRDRLMKCINDINLNRDSKDIVEDIISDVKNYAGGYQQIDDITLLCIKNEF